MLKSVAHAVRHKVRRAVQIATWGSIIQRIDRQGPIEDPLDVFNYGARANWGVTAPIQSREELVPLLALIKERRPKIAMEIGTARGGTLFMLTRVAALDALLISLDLPGGDWGGGYGEERVPLYEAFPLPEQKLHLLRADSHSPQSLEQVRTILGDRQIDYLFIDGDHTYEGVKQDYEMYGQLVRPGGLISFHDTHCTPGVVQLWQELKASHAWSREYVATKGTVYGIGVIEKPKA